MPPVTYTSAVMNARSVRIWTMAWRLDSCHSEASNMKKKETINQATITVSNKWMLTLLGVSLAMSSSTARRIEMTMTRTFTSHASHARSLNLMSPISACSCCVSIEDPPAEQAGLIDSGLPSGGCLAGEFRNHGEERHIQRNHNTAHR